MLAVVLANVARESSNIELHFGWKHFLFMYIMVGLFIAYGTMKISYELYRDHEIDRTWGNFRTTIMLFLVSVFIWPYYVVDMWKWRKRKKKREKLGLVDDDSVKNSNKYK